MALRREAGVYGLGYAAYLLDGGAAAVAHLCQMPARLDRLGTLAGRDDVQGGESRCQEIGRLPGGLQAVAEQDPDPLLRVGAFEFVEADAEAQPDVGQAAAGEREQAIEQRVERQRLVEAFENRRLPPERDDGERILPDAHGHRGESQGRMKDR